MARIAAHNGVWVPCRICWAVHQTVRLTARYCDTCSGAFCPEHGAFVGRGPAFDEPFNAFPSWFLRIECDRCGKVQMINQVHYARPTMLIREILAKMRHERCGGLVGKAELLTGIEGVSSRPVRRIVCLATAEAAAGRIPGGVLCPSPRVGTSGRCTKADAATRGRHRCASRVLQQPGNLHEGSATPRAGAAKMGPPHGERRPRVWDCG